MRRRSKKACYGTVHGRSYAVCVEGVDGDFFTRPLGRQLDAWKKIEAFKVGAKHGYACAKWKPTTMSAVKAWVKLNEPEQFFAVWMADSRFLKEDSVQVFYMGGWVDSEHEEEEQ